LPESVNDLSVESVSYSEITLTWTAPGDQREEGGPIVAVASYDLRYSTGELDATCFIQANTANCQIEVRSPGNKVTCTVSGLEAEQVYYFALRSIDSAGNASSLSNVVYENTSGICLVFDGPDQNERVRSSNEWISQDIVLLDFWASHCRWCPYLAQNLQRIYDNYSHRGVSVAGLSSYDSPAAALSYAQSHGLTYPLINIGTEDEHQDCGIGAYPTLMIVDFDSELVYSKTGVRSYEEIEAVILALIDTVDVSCSITPRTTEFNSRVHLDYMLSKPQFTTLNVFNVDGAFVSSIHTEKFDEAGSHFAYWYATDSNGMTVETGIYIVRLEAGDCQSAAQVIYIR